MRQCCSLPFFLLFFCTCRFCVKSHNQVNQFNQVTQASIGAFRGPKLLKSRDLFLHVSRAAETGAKMAASKVPVDVDA